MSKLLNVKFKSFCIHVVNSGLEKSITGFHVLPSFKIDILGIVVVCQFIFEIHSIYYVILIDFFSLNE